MANITLEAVEAVMAQAQAEYSAAKQALIDADGSVEEAVLALTKSADEVMDAEYTAAAEAAEEDACEDAEQECGECAQDAEDAEKAGKEKAKNDADELVAKLKDLVKKGNVDRIVIRHKDDVLLNIPVNVGLIGSVIGLAAAPWTVIAAAVATFGFSCKVEIVKKDGSKEEV